jgi:UPF0271 protein
MTSGGAIDLNADLGEVHGDLALMPFITSASIACGGHTGDRDTMAAAVRAALREGVAVGAHPSYPDREGFGRVDLTMPAADVAGQVAAQVSALASVAAAQGSRLAYLKLHGALYHRAGRDPECAEGIITALEAAGNGPLSVLAQPGSALLEYAAANGWPTAREGYCDRAYTAAGGLVSRSQPGAVLADQRAVVRQAISIALDGHVRAVDGSLVAVTADSICLHGDTPGAFRLAMEVRGALEEAGVVVAAFALP